MLLFEQLKKSFFSKETEVKNPSSIPQEKNVELDLDSTLPSVGFFNSQEDNYLFNTNNKQNLTRQNQLISTFRNIAKTAEIQTAINIIVDEAIFNPIKDPFEIVFKDEEIKKNLVKKISEELDNIQDLLNTDTNLYNIFKTFYTDGQVNVLCVYDENSIKKGIQKILLMSPYNLRFNTKTDLWEYVEDEGSFGGLTDFSTSAKNKKFSKEEFIHVNSGIFSDNIILSNLYFAIKPANMLQSLEDMLIPMRFSRSVSRRVFNVDISKLNAKKAEEVMRKYEQKFKYNNFYDSETGTIKNQQHIKAITEDYWFPNRDGGKGTQVDLLDETGNLGELDDILYFKRKLYTALQLPINRINDNGESDADFDVTATQVRYEEVKFFNFISRLRKQFVKLIYELLRRNLIAKGVIKEQEWDIISKVMTIKFSNENTFFENMQREKLQDNLNLLNSAEDYIGKYFPVNYIFKEVLKFTDDEIENIKEQIQKEKKDDFFKQFYEQEDEG